MKLMNLASSMSCALSCALVAGCASTRPASLAETTYYEGPSSVTLPDGRSFPGGMVLAQRTVSPSERSIREQVVSEDPRPGHAAREFNVLMRVTRSGFSMTESGGAFEGAGTLDGPAWRWTAWHSTSRLPDGSRVESADTMNDDELHVRKRVFDASGALQIETTEQLKRIDAARYAARRAAMLSARADK